MKPLAVTSRTPRLFFMLAAPLLTELLSGNMPLATLFQPTILIGLATIVYGFPLLLAWDWRNKRQLNVLGVLIAGCAYGVFNEGVMSKTIFASSNLPLPFFDSYLRWAGVNWAWAAPMVIWHAFHAIWYPLLFGEALFPAIRGHCFHETKKFRIRVVVIVVISGVLWFLPRAGAPHVAPVFLVEAWAAVALLLWLASRCAGEGMPRGEGRIWVFFAGIIFSVGYFFVPCILAATHQPAWFYAGYWLILAGVVIALRGPIARIGFRSWLLLACGSEVFFGAFGTLARMQRGERVGAALNGTLAALFVALAIYLKKRWRRAAESPSSAIAAESAATSAPF